MATLSFKHPDLKITETLTTTLSQVNNDSVVFTSHPDLTIPLDTKQIADFKLKVGDTVKLDPVVDTYTLTVDTPVNTSTETTNTTITKKKPSSPNLGKIFVDNLFE